MEIGQYVQIFLTFLISMYIKICTQVFIQQHQQSHWMQRVLIEPLLITQLIKSQFSDLSGAQNIRELFFFWIQHVQIRLEHILEQLYQQNAIASYFWCIINYPIN